VTVLIVDDEKHIRESIQRFLALEEIESACARDAEVGQKLLQEKNFDAVIIDLKLPGMDGRQLLSWMQSQGIKTPVIMISAHGEIRDAVEALKTGAWDYLVKPFDPAELVWKLREAVESRKRETLIEVGRRTENGKSGLIGESTAICKIRNQIDRIAQTPSKVLITGESGTGKEIVAREIHNGSRYRDEPFVAVNIGGLPETLIESELFGYEKGAFTGADSRKRGLFELAGKGTLFLDEIGEMALPLQVKLLRVLQDQKFRRLGSARDIPVDARIVSATNKDIEMMVEEGSFREDLFYRLNVVRIDVVPLRKRKEDIPLLANFLAGKLSRKMGIPGITLSSDTLEKLAAYDFPGNVRELENIIERAIIYRRGKMIEAADIDLPLPADAGSTSGAAGNPKDADTKSAGAESHVDTEPGAGSSSLRETERRAIVGALKRWKGNRTKAAEDLGISRRAIIYKIQKYGIEE
jgi:two-component system, NtrC family, response regulator AtoC